MKRLTASLFFLPWLIAGCGAPEPGGVVAPEPTAAPAAPTADAVEHRAPWFEDRTIEAGLGDFLHVNGMTGERLFSEMMGSGVAFLDYDGDGDLDVYAVQGGLVDPSRSADELLLETPPGPWIDRLYRNDSLHPLRFVDVTVESGLAAGRYGMGVTVGDVDNDGFPDLYLTNAGPDQLWRNRGDGTFENRTAASGLGSPDWSVSAAFLDFDRDGDLDLYVGGYVEFSVQGAKPCRSLTGRVDYCGPLTHPPTGDRLYRNRGDGTFEEVTRELGLGIDPAAGLGVAVTDFDDDGRLDLAVANDGMPNHLWRNEIDGDGGRFVEVAVTAGLSVNQEGQAEAGMGIVAADPDGDGDEDLVLTHLALETHTFYRNDGAGGFEDRTRPAGIGASTWDLTGFGIAFLDADMDGALDLAAVAGGVKILPEQLDAGEIHPLKMRKQLFRNVDGRFEEIPSAAAGPAFARLTVGRGLAVGDVDNDGDPDLLVANNGGPLELLVNGAFNGKKTEADRWVGLRLLDGNGRDALGATVLSPRRRRAGTDGSYASARDPRILLAVEPTRPPRSIRVRWVDGSVEDFPVVATGRYLDLRQGRGQTPEMEGS